MTTRSISARLGRVLVPGLPFLWLAAFFLLPFLIVLKISLSDPATAQPPYRRSSRTISWSVVVTPNLPLTT